MRMFRFVIVGLLCNLTLYADSVTNENGGNLPGITENTRMKSTPRQLAYMSVWTEINKYLPSKSRYRTFGVLTKLCDYIVIADILDISYAPEESNGRIREKAFIVFKMRVDESIYGKPNYDKFIITFSNYSRVVPVKMGDKVLLFLADYQWHRVDSYELKKWNFKQDAIVRNNVKNDLQLIYFYDGMINVSEEREKQQIVNAVKGYLDVFRKGDKDPDKYYQLLSKLMISGNKTLKDNAIQDMFLFCQSYKDFDVERAMNDSNLEDGMKKVIYYHSKPSRAESLVDAEMQKLSE